MVHYNGTASGSSAAKNIAEDIAKDISHICAGKIETAESARSAVSVKRSGTKLVVLASLIGITEHAVRLGSFFKLLRCGSVAGVRIRMVFFC